VIDDDLTGYSIVDVDRHCHPMIVDYWTDDDDYVATGLEPYYRCTKNFWDDENCWTVSLVIEKMAYHLH
jgi:hypothetical protein